MDEMTSQDPAQPPAGSTPEQARLFVTTLRDMARRRSMLWTAKFGALTDQDEVTPRDVIARGMTHEYNGTTLWCVYLYKYHADLQQRCEEILAEADSAAGTRSAGPPIDDQVVQYVQGVLYELQQKRAQFIERERSASSFSSYLDRVRGAFHNVSREEIELVRQIDAIATVLDCIQQCYVKCNNPLADAPRPE